LCSRKPGLEVLHPQVTVNDALVALSLAAEIFDQLMTLVAVMERFHCLLQADRDQQPQCDRPQVNPEVLPRV
jgi:hypothetical protein